MDIVNYKKIKDLEDRFIEINRLGIIKTVLANIDGCSGLALDDITDNGKIDMVTATSTENEGQVILLEQGDDYKDWTQHTIYTDGDEEAGIQAVDIGDFDDDGNLEIVALNVGTGEIILLEHDGDPTDENNWTSAVIHDDINPFECLPADIDGDGKLEIVYTQEGEVDGEGGVYWLDFEGGDVLDSNNWSNYEMVQQNGAWWLLPERLDLNENGENNDIVFTARDFRNDDAEPGLFWLEKPSDPKDTWTKHTIEDGLPHPLQVSNGNFFGNESEERRDLVLAGRYSDKDDLGIYIYDFNNDWEREKLSINPTISYDRISNIWNVKGIQSEYRGRDNILFVAGGSDISKVSTFEYIKGKYLENPLYTTETTHVMDSRIVLYDIDNDGEKEALIPDNNYQEEELVLFDFVNSAWKTYVPYEGFLTEDSKSLEEAVYELSVPRFLDLKLTGDKSITSGAWNLLEFDTVDTNLIDEENDWFDEEDGVIINPTNKSVYIRMTVNVRWEDDKDTGERKVRIMKDDKFLAYESKKAVNYSSHNLRSKITKLEPGEKIKIEVEQDSGEKIDIQEAPQTWLQFEIIK